MRARERHDCNRLLAEISLYRFSTVQNWIPRTLLPSLSRGGDQHIMPITLGTTSRMPPETPDLAGRPTYNTMHNLSLWQIVKMAVLHLKVKPSDISPGVYV